MWSMVISLLPNSSTKTLLSVDRWVGVRGMKQLLSVCLSVCHPSVCLSLQAYNITNDSPLPFWSYISQVLVGLGYPPPSRHLPYWLVLLLALLLQFIVWLLSPIITISPTFTPSRVRLAGTHHYYSCQRAKKDFGYTPPVTFEEGLRRTLEDYKLNN